MGDNSSTLYYYTSCFLLSFLLTTGAAPFLTWFLSNDGLSSSSVYTYFLLAYSNSLLRRGNPYSSSKLTSNIWLILILAILSLFHN